jgi:hypothetical protein
MDNNLKKDIALVAAIAGQEFAKRRIQNARRKNDLSEAILWSIVNEIGVGAEEDIRRW